MEKLPWQPPYDDSAPGLIACYAEIEAPQVSIELRGITEKDAKAWELGDELTGGVAVCVTGEDYCVPWHVYTETEWDAFCDGCKEGEFNLRDGIEPFDRVLTKDSKDMFKPPLAYWAVEYALMVEGICEGRYTATDLPTGMSSPREVMPLQFIDNPIEPQDLAGHLWTNRRLANAKPPTIYMREEGFGMRSMFITDCLD
jgi:hypothetical protein